jgi:hypothetical protein
MNFVELLKNELSGDMIGNLGRLVGEDEEKTKAATDDSRVMPLQVRKRLAEVPPRFPPDRARPAQATVKLAGGRVERVESIRDHRVVIQSVERLAREPDSLAQTGTKERRCQ